MPTPKRKEKVNLSGLIDSVFSWSLADVQNKNLFRGKVDEIPKRFLSTDHYFKSFIAPLLEETRADLLSNMGTFLHAPSCQILLDLKRSKDFEPPKYLLYNIVLRSRDKYEPQVGDLFALIDEPPRCISDLDRPLRPYTLAYIMCALDSNDRCKIISSKPIEFRKDGITERGSKRNETLFAVCLTNLTTNIRIWDALNRDSACGVPNIIGEVLQGNPRVRQKCNVCSTDPTTSAVISSSKKLIAPFELDDSQEDAILSCIAVRECHHRNTIKLIWGPPGTGKTEIVASLLFSLLKMQGRTLTCAPTNIAVIGVTKRLMSLVMKNHAFDTYGLGDILLFGNGERMKIDEHEDLYEVFLDYRVSELEPCLKKSCGWRSNLEFMISLLEDPKRQYNSYVGSQYNSFVIKTNSGSGRISNSNNDDKGTEKKRTWRTDIVDLLKEKKGNKQKGERVGVTKEGKNVTGNKADYVMTFEEFAMKKFSHHSEQLTSSITILYNHLPTSFLTVETAKVMMQILDILRKPGKLIHEVLASIEGGQNAPYGNRNAAKLFVVKEECLSFLKLLSGTLSLPHFTESHEIRNFCLKNARLIFCTASSSAKLHVAEMAPIEMVIIDEAAQLKECESCIPLQLPGLRHAVLIGDEKQLPAMVQSKISDHAGFGRSLFERLVKLGHPRHLLKVQYRMHPSISLFPRRQFYDNRIRDGPNVKGLSHDRHFLTGSIFGSYSFIDVSKGEETTNDEGSTKNVVEVLVAAEIVDMLHRVSVATKQKIHVGCISPYKAQVFAIQEKFGKRFGTDVNSNFSVNVRSIDGFQGREEDVIIISTVRCNTNGSVGFLHSLQRANVAITRARHCLWILGSGTTLISSGSIWKKIVLDAKSRGCFHYASEDENLNRAINEAFTQCGQPETVFRTDSPLFKAAKWKVCFSDEFLKSMTSIKSEEVNIQVISILKKLSSGWRMPHQGSSSKDMHAISSQLIEIYDVKGNLKLIWTTDILKEDFEYIQVIKIWDVMPSENITNLARRLDMLFEKHTTSAIARCKDKQIEGNLVLPKTWPIEATDISGKPVFVNNDGGKECTTTQGAAIRLTAEASTTSQTVHRNLVIPKTWPADANVTRKTPFAHSDDAREHITNQVVARKFIGEASTTSQAVESGDTRELLRKQLPATTVIGEASTASQRKFLGEASTTSQAVERNLVPPKTRQIDTNIIGKSAFSRSDDTRELLRKQLPATRVIGEASTASQRKFIGEASTTSQAVERNLVPPKTRQTDTNIIGKSAFSRSGDTRERLRKQLPATRIIGAASTASQRFNSNLGLPRAMPNDIYGLDDPWECLLVKQGTDRSKSYVAEESMCSCCTIL